MDSTTVYRVMTYLRSERQLRRESRAHRGTGGSSAGNAHLGFLPAFLDAASGQVFVSCHANGRPAAIHVLDGLPAALVLRRDARGRVLEVRAGVVAGFLRDGKFYSRAEAAQVVAREQAMETDLALVAT
jgi:hypothetical protein